MDSTIFTLKKFSKFQTNENTVNGWVKKIFDKMTGRVLIKRLEVLEIIQNSYIRSVRLLPNSP